MKGAIIGNGTSRRGFDLHRLDKVLTFGCNALYETYEPNYIAAIDVNQIETIGAIKERGWKWISREYRDAVPWITIDGSPVMFRARLNAGLNNNSGILAAASAVEIFGITELLLIGIDFFRQIPGEDNDIIGGNYPGGPGLTACWNTLIERNPQTRFIRVGPIHDRDRDYYDNDLKGFEYMSYEDLKI